jgi:hypothetical protein
MTLLSFMLGVCVVTYHFDYLIRAVLRGVPRQTHPLPMFLILCSSFFTFASCHVYDTQFLPAFFPHSRPAVLSEHTQTSHSDCIYVAVPVQPNIRF